MSELSKEITEFWADNSDGVKEILHFRGSGVWSPETWERLGDANLARFKKLKLLSGTWSIDSMVEWGVGGGANAVKFSRLVNSFYGTDIALQSITECERMLQKVRHNFSYYLTIIDIDNPEAACKVIPQVDFFLCTSVYQHFPSKDYGCRITKLAFDVLKDGGIALIQIKHGPLKQPENYYDDFAIFTVYDVNEFWGITLEIGFMPLAITISDNNYAYYYLQKPK